MEHQWSIVKHGATGTTFVEVDEHNRADIGYEMLAALLTQAGFIETTPVVDEDLDVVLPTVDVYSRVQRWWGPCRHAHD